MKSPKHPTASHSQGYALITVMVMSFLGSLVVFNTLQENVNQERMSGNYTKELNAHLQAESGMADAYNTLLTAYSSNSSLTVTQLAALLPSSSTGNSTDGYSSIAQDSSLTTTTAIGAGSSGSYYEGGYDMSIVMTPGAGSSSSVYSSAITTCQGAMMSGSGIIDSYDSSLGSYSVTGGNANGDINVIEPTASGLIISGGGSVQGNVTANGNLYISGSGSVSGDAHVSGTINLSYDAYDTTTDFTQYSGGGNATIDGDAQAEGNIITSTASSSTLDSITANFDVRLLASYSNDINYTGTLYYENAATADGTVTQSSSGTTLVSAVPTETCDTKGLSTDIVNFSGFTGATDIEYTSWPYWDYEISNTGIQVYNKSSSEWETITATTSGVSLFGNTTQVYDVDIINFQDYHTLTITSGSDVTLYLNSPTSLGGKIIIEDNASLQLVTSSSFALTAGGSITGEVTTTSTDATGVVTTTTTTATSAVNSSNTIYFELVSAYDSGTVTDDYGVTIDGNTDTFVSVYAPDSAVLTDNSGDIFGSLRSYYITIAGDGGIHYDEAMATAQDPGTSSSATLSIDRWM